MPLRLVMTMCDLQACAITYPNADRSMLALCCAQGDVYASFQMAIVGTLRT
jgi:hypothetical protein